MTRPHVLDQLPFWVEGDLPQDESAAVDRHLAACPACREAGDHLRLSQAWLREALEPPFDAADHARLRRVVLDRLRAEPLPESARPAVLRPAVLAAAAVVVAVLTWDRPRGGTTPAPQASASPVPAPPIATETTAIPAPTQPLPPRLRLAREVQTRAHLQARLRPDPAALPRGEPTRIEFQTADPTVRIIWLAQATPLPGTNPTLEENP